MHKSYNLKKYNGDNAPITHIEDVTGVDTSTSLTFYGKNFQHYGKGFNENFLHLMEKFRSNSASAPTNPMMGQMWFDDTLKQMMVYNGTVWDILITVLPQQLNWSGSFTQVISGNNSSFSGTVIAQGSNCKFNTIITPFDYTITNLLPNFTPTIAVDTTTNQISITLSGSIVKTTPSFTFNIAFKQSAFTNVYDIVDLLYNPKAIALNFASVTNNLPGGDVIITGIPTVDETLTASNNLTDADGIGTIYYQWMKNGININSATYPNYTVASSDVSSVITVKAFYTDDLGFYNSKTSAGVTIAVPLVPSVVLSIVTPFIEKSTNVGEFEGKIKITTTDCTINSIYDYASQIAAAFNNIKDSSNGPATIDPVVIVKDIASTSTELLLTITATSDIHQTNLSGNIIIDSLLLSATVDSSQLLLPITITMRPASVDIVWDNTNMLQEELNLNDGTMTGQLLVNLPTDFTFVASPSITMTPIAGLTPVITLNTAKTVGTITLTGQATTHDVDYTNITFTVLASDITTTTLGSITPASLAHTIDIGMTAPVYNVTWDNSNPLIEDISLNDGTISGQLKAILPTGFTFNSALVTMTPTIAGTTVVPTLNVATNELTITLTGQATTHDTTYSNITFDLGVTNTSNTIPGTLDVTTLSHTVDITMYPVPTTTTTTVVPTTTTTVVPTTTTTTVAPVILNYSSIKLGVTWGGAVDLDTVVAAYDSSGICTKMKTAVHPDAITGVVYGGDVTTGGIEEYYNIDLTAVTDDKLVLGILEYTANSFTSMTSLTSRIVDNSTSTNIVQTIIPTVTKSVSNTANTTYIVGVFTKSGGNWSFTPYQKLLNSHNGIHAIWPGDTFASLGL
jgi:stress response protein SCP2